MADDLSRSDAVLAAGLRRGDAACLDDMKQAFAAPLRRRLKAKYAGALAPDEPEDILNLVLWEAWQHCSRYDPEKGPLEAWLWSIADHLAASLLRRAANRARRLETPVAPEALAQLADPRAGAEGADAPAQGESRLAELLDEGLAALPERQRLVLNADANSPTGTAPTPALALELGVSPEVIRQDRCRGLRALEDWLRAHAAPELIAEREKHGQRAARNGERGTGNGERGTGNGERGTGNGERGTGNGERGTGNDSSALRPAFPGPSGPSDLFLFFLSRACEYIGRVPSNDKAVHPWSNHAGRFLQLATRSGRAARVDHGAVAR